MVWKPGPYVHQQVSHPKFDEAGPAVLASDCRDYKNMIQSLVNRQRQDGGNGQIDGATEAPLWSAGEPSLSGGKARDDWCSLISYLSESMIPCYRYHGATLFASKGSGYSNLILCLSVVSTTVR